MTIMPSFIKKTDSPYVSLNYFKNLKPRVTPEHILERVNSKFQHKHKPKEASVNDNITHTIVTSSRVGVRVPPIQEERMML